MTRGVTKCFAADIELAALFRSGLTLQAIGDKFGITRERVRQRISRIGVLAVEGGRTIISRRFRDKQSGMKDLRYIQRYGCTYEQYQAIRKSPRTSSGARPLRSYTEQKRNAATRGISWQITLAEWWAVWKASGKWTQRGRGRLYNLCRRNDVGPYSITNVYIARGDDNVRDYQSRKQGKNFARVGEVFDPVIA